MPEKEKRYDSIVFTPEVIRETINTLVSTLKEDEREQTGQQFLIKISDKEKWSYDNEGEFFAEYIKRFEYARFAKSFSRGGGSIEIWVHKVDTTVNISMRIRSDVEKVFYILESNVDKCRIPEPPKPRKKRPRVKIFIGHGHDNQWKDLKDHLHEKQGFEVEHYEHGARAGLTIKEVLDDMLTSSSFALLVLTGEDLDAEGELRARENVIHELGLFQGRLGWRRAIILKEEGVEEFSNIHGVNQIRFNKGNIQATYGEVLATLKREFSLK